MIEIKDPTIILVAAFIWLLLPFIPLALLWARAYREVLHFRGWIRTVSVGVTLSFSFFFISIENTNLIGLHYTNRRYLTILLNLGLMLVAAGFSLVVKNPLRWRLFWTAMGAAWLWWYALAVSSVV